MKQTLKKIGKISGITLGTLLLLMVLLPMLFPNFVARHIKQWANEAIEGELNFSKARLSFFHHFPHLTLTIYDYSLTGSAPFEKDTLVYGKELGFGIDISSLLGSTVEVNRFFVAQSTFHIRVDENGNANYNIYKTGDTSQASSTDSGSARLNIEAITISDSRLQYDDHSIPMHINASGFNYKGSGDFANNEFDLVSKLRVDSFDFAFDGVPYIQHKKLEADLITGINTSSLAIHFQKNDLRINQLPVQFSGDLLVLKEGYDIALDLISGTTDFGNIFSALPPAYNQWFAQTTFSGTSQITLDLKGKYNAATGQAPHLHAHLWVKNGSIRHQQAPAPFQHFYVAADFSMPSLNTDSIAFTIDSLKFELNGEKTFANLYLKGLQKPMVKAYINSRLDAALLQQALGIRSYSLAGKLQLQASLNGIYDEAQKRWPQTNAHLQIVQGSIQTPYYPAPLEQIQVDARLSNPGGHYRSVQIALQPVSFQLHQQPFAMSANIQKLEQIDYDIKAKGILDLEKIYQVFAIKGYQLSGWLQTDVSLRGNLGDASAGRYQKLDNKGTIDMKQISMLSPYYRKPFEIPEGHLKIQQDKAWLQQTTMRFGSNEWKITGYLQNLLGYYLTGSTLKGGLTLQSKKLVLSDFAAPIPNDSTDTNTPTPAEAAGVWMLPNNIDWQMKASIDTVAYNETQLLRFKGALQLKNGALALQQTRAQIAGAQLSMQGSYRPLDPQHALFDVQLKADSFNIKRAYREVPLLREMASAAAYASGLVSVDYALAGQLDAQMMPVYPSLKGQGIVTLEQVQIKGMKLFGAVSKATGKDSLNNPRLKAVVIRSSVANNTITIERTKMRIFGFRPRIEGTTTLDGKLNFRMRLGLPPFGIIGIPIAITGNAAHPKVKIRPGHSEDTEDEEEENAEDERE
jgi:AsmA protein